MCDGRAEVRITRKKFKEATGCDPVNDDLERCNCKRAGEITHTLCGWDKARNLPVFWPKIPDERVGEIMNELRRRQMN
jgi:hypothetical protein